MQARIRALADNLADELFANGSPADIVDGSDRKCRDALGQWFQWGKVIRDANIRAEP
jgi:hypothetical protein